MHVRLHHNKIFDKTLKHRFKEKNNNYIKMSITSSHLFIFMTKMQIACHITFSINFSITSINLIASIVSIAFKFFTLSSNSFSLSMIKHQKQHRKSYFIIDDLFEIFVKISNKKNKNIIQKISFFRIFLNFRQFHHEYRFYQILHQKFT